MPGESLVKFSGGGRRRQAVVIHPSFSVLRSAIERSSPVSGNLHKSDEGWVRLQARVNADLTRQSVRSARMDHRVSVPKPVARKRKGDVASEEVEVDFIVRKGRTQRRAFVAQNGRSE